MSDEEKVNDTSPEEVSPVKEQRFILTTGLPNIFVHGKLYTRREISEGTAISMSMISKIFRGTRKPSLEVSLRLAQFFHVTVEELVAFIIPSAVKDSNSAIDEALLEVKEGKRELRQTYQGVVCGPTKDSVRGRAERKKKWDEENPKRNEKRYLERRLSGDPRRIPLDVKEENQPGPEAKAYIDSLTEKFKHLKL